VAYYEADPELETVLVGDRCEACGIAVSEEGRQKEKLGGKGGKGIAKAKCPKCEQKMGNVPLYTLKSLTEQPAEASESADESAQQTPAEATTDATAGESPATESTTTADAPAGDKHPASKE